MNHYIKKKIFCFIYSCCFCLGLITHFSYDAYGLSKKQIVRNIGINPRSVEKKRRSKKKIERTTEDNFIGFRIHKDFTCNTKPTSDFKISAISEASLINTENIDDVQTFTLTIQIIKAHLNIVLKAYSVNGINLDLQKYPVRFHSDDELAVYPEDIALEPEEPLRIFIPDTLRSAVYIQYVILPVLQDFIPKKDYKLLQQLMSVISFMNVFKHNQKQTILNYKDYKKYIIKTKEFLDNIQNKFFKEQKNATQSVTFHSEIMRALLINNWISFLALRSCGFIPYPEDPQYDANLYYEATDARDNYLMGLGIFEQFKENIKNYNFNNSKNAEYIKNYNAFFDNFYQNIEPPEKDSLPFDAIRQLHINAFCVFHTMPFKKCQKITDAELQEING